MKEFTNILTKMFSFKIELRYLPKSAQMCRDEIYSLILGNLETSYDQKYKQHMWTFVEDHWPFSEPYVSSWIVDRLHFQRLDYIWRWNIEKIKFYQVLKFWCIQNPSIRSAWFITPGGDKHPQKIEDHT